MPVKVCSLFLRHLSKVQRNNLQIVRHSSNRETRFAHFFGPRYNRETENFKMKKAFLLPQMRPSGFSHNGFEEAAWKFLASKMLFLNCSTAAARPEKMEKS